jgi:signal transduction histidine kinase
MIVRRDDRDAYQTWLAGEILLVALLGASLALFLTTPSLDAAYALPHLRLVVATAITLAAGIVAVLAGARFGADGRRTSLLLSTGFFVVAASNGAFVVAPAVAERLSNSAAWAGVAAGTFAAICIAAAPFANGRVSARERALGGWIVFLGCSLVALWTLLSSIGGSLPSLVDPGDEARPALLIAYGGQALAWLVAAVGFGLRVRRGADDLHRWVAFAASLLLFSSLHLVLAPTVGVDEVSYADFLRVLAFGVLLVGVWRAIRAAEFGRAVADERARLAREIHDGLAQYLFSISTHAAMLQNGGSPETLVPQIRNAATAAQQEARFAILALSSAGGTAPFDAALRRYVELLTADGMLDVDLEIDPGAPLDPDEQIEIFRIVQEALANARRHAGARCATVRIERREGRRRVTIVDDGKGFDGTEAAGGQGLRNIRARAAAIGGTFSLRTAPGTGTALEVALR